MHAGETPQVHPESNRCFMSILWENNTTSDHVGVFIMLTFKEILKKNKTAESINVLMSRCSNSFD